MKLPLSSSCDRPSAGRRLQSGQMARRRKSRRDSSDEAIRAATPFRRIFSWTARTGSGEYRFDWLDEINDRMALNHFHVLLARRAARNRMAGRGPPRNLPGGRSGARTVPTAAQSLLSSPITANGGASTPTAERYGFIRRSPLAFHEYSGAVTGKC